MVAPLIYRVQEMQLLQQKDQVTLIYMQDHEVRRVRLNATHPARVTPTWHGDSIGHYERDTLVVVAARGPRARTILGTRQPADRSVAGWALRAGETVLLHGGAYAAPGSLRRPGVH